MKQKDNEDMYDAVIIGAGIGGLVCGCYLAKAGMKVLIAEQHHKAGGYCTSFKRKDFTFDAAAHCFGGYRENGVTRKVFQNIGLDKRINIIRFDPTDIIITPDYQTSFWADLDKTIQDFQAAFPDEKNSIHSFFNFVLNPDPRFFSRIRSWTFRQLLDHYFRNDKLKAILSSPLLGNGGLPPSLMSAFVGAKLFSEFLLDGGYYPEGGMQALPDALGEIFKGHGGELRLSSLVKKITVDDARRVTGVILEKNESIHSKYVISDCDARQTFFKLLGRDEISKDFCDRMEKMMPSLSDYVLYLGVDSHFETLPKPRIGFWIFSHYDLERSYRAARKGNLEGIGGYFLRVAPDRSILAIMPAPFKTKNYWISHKHTFMQIFIEMIEKSFIPGLQEHIIYKEAATPHTLYRYTLNQRGASFGWEGTPEQLAVPDFRKPSFLKNLYCTGHWTTQGLGISGVVYLGSDTARSILRREKIPIA
jgi:phytoene dehydrogenase-like protein